MNRKPQLARPHWPKAADYPTGVTVGGLVLWIGLLAFIVTAIPADAQSSEYRDDETSEPAFAELFARADSGTGAMFRWWWPGAAVEPEILRAQLDAIAEAGYKGVEIADVKVAVDYPVDPDLYQYGSPAWRLALETVATYAEELNLQVDITMGPHWPIAVPGLDVDGPASSKELIGAFVILDGNSYAGPAPSPEPLRYTTRSSVGGQITERHATAAPALVAAGAMRCRTETCDRDAPELDLTSFVDLTEMIENDQIDWQAPNKNDWVVLAHWQRGTGQRNDAPWGTTPYLVTDPESRVVDHFSLQGADAFLEYFATTISDEAIAAIARVGGAMFEDSIELKAAQLWTANMLAEFEARRGYDAVPYLACVTYEPADGPFDEPAPVFRFSSSDSETCQQVRRDFAQTLANLYLENHLLPLKRWANDRGIRFRAQAYGIPIDMAEAAAMLDVAEDESFASGASDDWKLVASGVEAAGKTLVSDEFIAGGFGGTYRMSTQQLVREVNGQYSLGANQLIFHGLPYEEWPPPAGDAQLDSLVRWPGYRAFMTRIPDAFGPRNPTWGLEHSLAAYYARTQLILQSGQRRRDIAVYNQSLNHIQDPFEGDKWLGPGFSYGYITPGLMRVVPPEVVDRRLYPEGPAYKAIILDRQETVTLAAAESLLRISDHGTPIIVLGDAPLGPPGIDAHDGGAKARIAQAFDEILSQNTLLAESDASELKSLFEELNIGPAVQSPDSTTKIIHRQAGNANYYFVANLSADESAGEFRFCASGVPYHLDAWSGHIMRIAKYRVDRGCIVVNLTQQPGDADLFAVAPAGSMGELPLGAPLPVVDSTADSVYIAGSDLIVRQLEAKPAQVTFADGTVIDVDERPMPRDLSLEEWELRVESFFPADPSGKSTVTGREVIAVGAIDLLPWSKLPRLGPVSGIGTYTTEFELDAEWAGMGAYFEFGEMSGAFSIAVNGEDVGALNQLDRRFDLGQRLRPGLNRIEVRVMTNLNNVLRTLFPADYGTQPLQHYGLAGPTSLRPYRDTIVSAEGTT